MLKWSAPADKNSFVHQVRQNSCTWSRQSCDQSTLKLKAMGCVISRLQGLLPLPQPNPKELKLKPLSQVGDNSSLFLPLNRNRVREWGGVRSKSHRYTLQIFPPPPPPHLISGQFQIYSVCRLISSCNVTSYYVIHVSVHAFQNWVTARTLEL